MLRNRGFRVVEIWKCQWEKLKREREDVCAFVDALNLSAPLNPPDAFFGGRTNALRLYHKVDETRGEKIHYFDFMSLYPWVNKNGKYPLGHPEIISQPGHTDLSRYFGLAKFHCFHPMVSSIPCYLTVMPANSPFRSVPPAWPRKCPNPFWSVLPSVLTRIRNANS